MTDAQQSKTRAFTASRFRRRIRTARTYNAHTTSYPSGGARRVRAASAHSADARAAARTRRRRQHSAATRRHRPRSCLKGRMPTTPRRAASAPLPASSGGAKCIRMTDRDARGHQPPVKRHVLRSQAGVEGLLAKVDRVEDGSSTVSLCAATASGMGA